MLCSHVERPEQLGASVSQRLDLLPRAGMEEGWKRVRGREGVMNNWGDWGEGMGGLHEDGFRKVIGRDGGGGLKSAELLAKAVVRKAITGSWRGWRGLFSGEEEGRESEKGERGERGYGHEPRPGRAQSTRCKNANRPPLPSSPLPKGGEKEKRENKKAKQEMHLKM